MNSQLKAGFSQRRYGGLDHAGNGEMSVRRLEHFAGTVITIF
jgi:hypothetical protein